jgi:ABC-2 type transport system ATP-binding protein
MKDVAALCQRAVIISQGQIHYDGSLSGIVDSFSADKVVTVQFSEDQPPADLSRFGQVVELKPPRTKLRIQRNQVAKALVEILSQHAVDDLAVEDPPLEEVIAAVFRQASDRAEKSERSD